MSEEEKKEQIAKAKAYAEKQKFKKKLKEIKYKYSDKKPLTFGKWGFIFLIANCTVVEIYSMLMMYFFQDLSTLPSLIVAVVGECICMVSYNVKSQIDNSANGLTFELAMREKEPCQNPTGDDDQSVG